MPTSDETHSIFDRLSSSLLSAVLVMLILWIGQTTFRHATTLAEIDEKIVEIDRQFKAVELRQAGMRKWLDDRIGDLTNLSRLQYTQPDGDKLCFLLRQLEQAENDRERRFTERQTVIELKIATLEASHRDSQEVAALKIEIAQLQSDLARATATYEEQGQASERVARKRPVFLPPVEIRR